MTPIDDDLEDSPPMVSTARSVRKAVPRGSGLPGGRLYDAADALMWVGGLNLLVITFTALGGLVLGLAPALVAAVSVSRARLRGDQQPLLRTFADLWRREFRAANLLLAPFALAGGVLGFNLVALGSTGGPMVWALWAALALVVATATVALVLRCHYDVALRRCAALALRYVLHDPASALLLLAVTALVVAIGAFVPGLVVVLGVGAWVHTVTALCLSFFTRNDELVAATPPPSGSLPAPTKGTR